MDNQTKLALLKDARDRIADPARWSIGALARNSRGMEVGVSSPFAVKWCASGSIAKSFRTDGRSFISDDFYDLDLEVALSSESGYRALSLINDHLGHGAVLEAFDRAIAQLETT